MQFVCQIGLSFMFTILFILMFCRGSWFDIEVIMTYLFFYMRWIYHLHFAFPWCICMCASSVRVYVSNYAYSSVKLLWERLYSIIEISTRCTKIGSGHLWKRTIREPSEWSKDSEFELCCGLHCLDLIVARDRTQNSSNPSVGFLAMLWNHSQFQMDKSFEVL